MDVIHNEILDPSLTFFGKYKEKTNTITSSSADEGTMKDTSCMAFAKNIPMLFIHNGGSNAHRTLRLNNKNKGNDVVSRGVKTTCNDEVIVDNQNSAQSSRITSLVGIVEPNAHPTSKYDSNLLGNAKKQKACRRKKLAMASEFCSCI